MDCAGVIDFFGFLGLIVANSKNLMPYLCWH